MKKTIILALLTMFMPRLAFASMPVVANPFLNGVVLTVVFAALGIVLMIIAYRLIDAVTPGNLGKELTENKNTALAILVGSMIIGVSMIISAALLG